jgi:hypothetical protein
MCDTQATAIWGIPAQTGPLLRPKERLLIASAAVEEPAEDSRCYNRASDTNPDRGRLLRIVRCTGRPAHSQRTVREELPDERDNVVPAPVDGNVGSTSRPSLVCAPAPRSVESLTPAHHDSIDDRASRSARPQSASLILGRQLARGGNVKVLAAIQEHEDVANEWIVPQHFSDLVR